MTRLALLLAAALAAGCGVKAPPRPPDPAKPQTEPDAPSPAQSLGEKAAAPCCGTPSPTLTPTPARTP